MERPRVAAGTGRLSRPLGGEPERAHLVHASVVRRGTCGRRSPGHGPQDRTAGRAEVHTLIEVLVRPRSVLDRELICGCGGKQRQRHNLLLKTVFNV